MATTRRLEMLLETNPEFAEAYRKLEPWALQHAQMVLGIDGQADRRHPERTRHEDGVTPRNWCGQCPVKGGCITCDLDEFPQVMRSNEIGAWPR